ncbi:MAG: hypothetical protein KY476_07050 [Planctomycetes bacterium]|nr:hypothetical protein [Planctomycetota bacterium]
METVVRHVRDLSAADRQALERVVGQALHVNEQVAIRILSGSSPVSVPEPTEASTERPAELPEWCNVYEGLTDEEIDRIEASIVRSPAARSFE